VLVGELGRVVSELEVEVPLRLPNAMAEPPARTAATAKARTKRLDRFAADGEPLAMLALGSCAEPVANTSGDTACENQGVWISASENGQDGPHNNGRDTDADMDVLLRSYHVFTLTPTMTDFAIRRMDRFQQDNFRAARSELLSLIAAVTDGPQTNSRTQRDDKGKKSSFRRSWR